MWHGQLRNEAWLLNWRACYAWPGLALLPSKHPSGFANSSSENLVLVTKHQKTAWGLCQFSKPTVLHSSSGLTGLRWDPDWFCFSVQVRGVLARAPHFLGSVVPDFSLLSQKAKLVINLYDAGCGLIPTETEEKKHSHWICSNSIDQTSCNPAACDILWSFRLAASCSGGGQDCHCSAAKAAWIWSSRPQGMTKCRTWSWPKAGHLVLKVSKSLETKWTLNWSLEKVSEGVLC